jgi:hypothetical protein
MNAGLREALCALSYFRNRHKLSPRYRKAGLRRNQEKMASHYKEWVRMARFFCREARKEGWRGSISAAVERGEAR